MPAINCKDTEKTDKDKMIREMNDKLEATQTKELEEDEDRFSSVRKKRKGLSPVSEDDGKCRQIFSLSL